MLMFKLFVKHALEVSLKSKIKQSPSNKHNSRLWSTAKREALLTCKKVSLAFSASIRYAGVPPRSKHIFFSSGGVGDDASGYNLGSRLVRERGGLKISGGNDVVVVVVVVTTVVFVAGAYESCARVACDGIFSGKVGMRPFSGVMCRTTLDECCVAMDEDMRATGEATELEDDTVGFNIGDLGSILVPVILAGDSILMPRYFDRGNARITRGCWPAGRAFSRQSLGILCSSLGQPLFLS